MRRQADLLFDDYLEPLLQGYKREEKRRAFHYVVHAAKQAYCLQGVVRYSRQHSEPGNSKLKIQVIEAAVKSGLMTEVRSPKGSPSMSRLIPTEEMTGDFSLDPWQFEAADDERLVRLVERTDEKKEIDFDPAHPTARAFRKKIKLVNQVNARFDITVRRYLPLKSRFAGTVKIRPVHYAVFTESFDLHGRLYTGRFGHQSLRKIERQWICFDGEHCKELDFSAFHTRMLYHLEGLECLSDPYHLWGDDTTELQRMVVKQLMNSLINARTETAAVKSCNYFMSQYTPSGALKRGKDLEDARKLYDAVKQTDLKFAKLIPLVHERHYRIAKHFCNDTGIRLMNRDSRIAMNVLYHFAKRDIPCLGVHDSFIVPEHSEAELKEVMHRCYRNEVGDFSPVIE